MNFGNDKVGGQVYFTRIITPIPERPSQFMMTNLGSCFLGLKYAAPIMKKQGSGSIINNGSTAGITLGRSAKLQAERGALMQKVISGTWQSSC